MRSFIGLARTAVLASALIAPAAAAQDFLTFHCADGSEFVSALFAGTRSVYVQLDGKALTLPRRISLSRPRYAAGGVTLWIKDRAATLRRDRVSTECTAD